MAELVSLALTFNSETSTESGAQRMVVVVLISLIAAVACTVTALLCRAIFRWGNSCRLRWLDILAAARESEHAAVRGPLDLITPAPPTRHPPRADGRRSRACAEEATRTCTPLLSPKR